MHRVKLHLESHLTCLDLVHATVDEMGKTMGWVDEIVFHIKLAVSESLTNIIFHGYQGEQGHPIDLSLEAEREKLVVTIVDSGVPFAIELQPEADLDPWKDHGRGIFIINQLMNEVKSERTGQKNCLKLVKDIESDLNLKSS